MSHPEGDDAQHQSLRRQRSPGCDSSDIADLGPPTKRSKTDMEKPVSLYPKWSSSGFFWKNAKVWYSEGDTIIICEGMGFRVQRKTIVDRSEVLRKMFDDSNLTSEEIYEGCNIIRVEGSSVDFYYLFQALRGESYLRELCDTEAEVVHQLLRSSTKYTVKGIRDYAIDWITSRFPSTLKNYKSVERPPSELSLVYALQCWHALEIAKEFSIPIIIPAALYACSLMSGDDIRQFRNGYFMDLYPRVQATLDDFEDQFRADKHERLRKFGKCQNTDKKYVWERTDGHYSFSDKDSVLSESAGFDVFYRTVTRLDPCEKCLPGMEKEEQDMKNILWDSLPLHCGLGDWERVRLLQEAADKRRK